MKPWPTVSTLVLLGALGACASTPERNASLEQARVAVNSVQSDPAVARDAPLELKRAQDTLRQAEQMWRDNASNDQIQHYSYLAGQRAAIAREAAGLKGAEDAVRTASQERERVLLQARTQEADTAKQQAASSQREAEMARQQAQSRAAEAATARQQATTAEQRATRLEQQLSELNAQQTDRGISMTLSDVLFDVGQATLKPGAERRIQQLATLLKDNPDRVVLIEGFTDSVGDERANQQLSERRAQSVREALALQGVDPNRVQIHGYGEAYPVASNSTAAGRQQNRRVEVVISNQKGPIPQRGVAGRPGNP